MSKVYIVHGKNNIDIEEESCRVCLSEIIAMADERDDVCVRVSFDHFRFLEGDTRYWPWMNTILDRAGVEKEEDELVFVNKKANFIHLVSMLCRIPLECPVALDHLKLYLEDYDYDPLRVAIALHKDRITKESRIMDIHNVYAYPDAPTNLFSFKKAIDDLSTTFYCINDAWMSGIRVGIVE